MKTKYFLYARKSTEDEDRQIMSIEAQIAELTELAHREKLLIAKTFIESKTAKKPGREIFNQMIEKIHNSNEPIGILAWHPDRLARNSIDGGQIIYLIDTGKISALRCPTFWFEPTPQGLFMLQVAFGQSKYYSDNLSENIKRGIRQKLRRGEWTNRAPFGYVRNPKTRNIEPEPFKSKIIKKAFQEFSENKHSLESLRHRLAFWGVVQNNGKPIVKSAVKRMLTNKAYIGIIVNKGESYEGNFPTIIPKPLFDKVQKVLAKRSRPRKTKQKYDFPFRGLLTCSECGSPITAQFGHGRGGTYRYYRCTKRRGKCSQGYIQEKVLAKQLEKYFLKIALPENWTQKMFLEIDLWQKDHFENSNDFSQNLEKKINETQAKLDKLVDAFLDGMIDKNIYLVKKDELINQKTSFLQEKKDFRQKNRSWFEPLREFVKAAHRAEKLASSNDYHEIKSFAEKIGSNILLQDRKVVFYFKKPFDLIPKFISTTARRNAAPKNSIQQNLSVENIKIRRLKSPINTSVDKNPLFSVGGKIPPDFLSKNRLNRHQKSIENDKDCRLCEKCAAAGFGKCNFAFSQKIPDWN